MSFELDRPLINILGMSRYDLPACIINNNIISNWKRAKDKLCLTYTEHKLLMKQIKTSLGIDLTEHESGSGLTLKLNKSVSNQQFNDNLRNFINDHKICKKCKCPELRDGNCNGCGFITNKLDDNKPNINDKKTLTKQEKRILKIKAQQLKESVKEDNIDDNDNTNTLIDVVTVNELNNVIDIDEQHDEK